ncbi:MAG: DUF309 domain-containing protein [Planctomycetota bacterium]|nr:DUF309 domain-containing protein [Planctomycetota bacterium]MDA1212386.1 DUF309 domain-containing protein [Planctomycetota bacterium]
MQDLPEQYLEGIRLFNEEEFFECHDVLEELWADNQGEEKKFLQGMIQASVALFHFGNENYGGARKLYDSSTKYLTPYAPVCMGIDLEKFLNDMATCFYELRNAGPEYPTDIVLNDDLVPKIHFAEERG